MMTNRTPESMDAVEALVAIANMAPSERNDVIDGILREHRTHQQSVMRFILALLRAYAKAYRDKAFDQRNEAGLYAATIAIEAVERADADALPYI